MPSSIALRGPVPALHTYASPCLAPAPPRSGCCACCAIVSTQRALAAPVCCCMLALQAENHASVGLHQLSVTAKPLLCGTHASGPQLYIILCRLPSHSDSLHILTPLAPHSLTRPLLGLSCKRAPPPPSTTHTTTTTLATPPSLLCDRKKHRGAACAHILVVSTLNNIDF